MTVINTNTIALNAQSALAANQVQMSRTMQRLSTGVRINSAKDDAAGLAISNRMTTDIRGYGMAIRNANDGVSLAQTAEGHLSQITSNLQRIRELAVQSANATNSTADRRVIDIESDQIVAEIDGNAINSKFNGVNLLDGTYTNRSFQIGADNESASRIAMSIGSVKAGALGVGSGSSYATSVTGAAGDATALLAGALSINGYTTGAAAADGVSYVTSSASGIAVAAAINAISGSSGVTATVAATGLAGTTVTGHATAITAGDVLINGVDIGAIAAGPTAANRGAQVTAAINAITAQTGVTATFAATTGVVALSAADGRNITVTTTAAATAAATGLGSGGATTLTTRSVVSLASTGSAGITVAGSTAASLTAAGLTAATTAATVTVGAGLSSVDLTTVAGSQAALTTLDAAIATVNTARSNLGAYQNRLQFAVSDLQISSGNLSASRSRIMDTDYAAETANLARSQIISQAATAMLAQANQQPKTVLELLK
jgi:flagellin